MRGVLALAMLGGCGFSLSFGDGTPADSSVDVALADAPCDFSTFIDTCGLPQGASLDLVGDHTFDTDGGILKDAIGNEVPVKTAIVNLAHNGIDVQAIFVDKLGLDGVLTARGSRPFAIIARNDVELVGTSVIEVGMGGAGAQSTCDHPASDGQQRNTGGGGGGGGALGAMGGHGGDGDRGGGAGGGAVFVVSATKIVIGGNAGINAGGAGGKGGLKNSDGDAGGGGGGSGGTILLEAPRVRNDGTLSANGGGGGEGSDDGGSAGHIGYDATLGTASAMGGDGNSSGGAGGAFGGNSSAPSGGPKPPKKPGGGGGGGGSIGFIRIVASEMTIGSKVSPTPVP
jgi:hypothetical protein